MGCGADALPRCFTVCLHIFSYSCVRFKRCVGLTFLLKDSSETKCLCLYVIVALIRFFNKGVQTVCVCICEAQTAHRRCGWMYCERVKSSLDDA